MALTAISEFRAAILCAFVLIGAASRAAAQNPAPSAEQTYESSFDPKATQNDAQTDGESNARSNEQSSAESNVQSTSMSNPVELPSVAYLANAAASGTKSDIEPHPQLPLDTPEPATSLAKRFANDQASIWTSPARLSLADATWLLPLAGVAAGMMVTDHEVSRHLNAAPQTLTRWNNFSNYGAISMGAGAAGMYFLGRIRSRAKYQETGFLAGEAVVNSLAVSYALKYATRRERPYVDDARGHFWAGGDSFPSEHATAAWAIAGIVAHEYPGPLTQLLAYGGAAAIGVARIQAQQHFSSDVLVGSMIGWYTARHIYLAHHDSERGGAAWDAPGIHPEHGREWEARDLASPYVPLDSWVYRAFDRLAGLGLIRTEILGLRPWTRRECARLVNEAANASDAIDTHGQDIAEENSEGGKLYAALSREFAGDAALLEGGEHRAVQLESVYARTTVITGKPLTDGYHFGETLTNDFGRPYEEGVNAIAGFSGWVADGPLAGYVRGEYQYAPGAPGNSSAVAELISSLDDNPVVAPGAIRRASQFHLLDSYVAINYHDWQVSAGNESLWWGPEAGGPMLMSDNAAPVTMLRVDRDVPFLLPSVFRFLGPARISFFLGGLARHQYPAGPAFHGEKISFKPLPGLELGFSRTAVFAGVGRPLTLASLWDTYVSAVSSESPQYSARINPGKRSGGFDITYRVPFVPYGLSVYSDSLSDDDPSPLAAFVRAGIVAGVYLARIPGIAKLDLRVESVYTNVPSSGALPGKYIYFDDHYHDLYTNRGQLMGSWIGRDASGIEAWSRYWLTARNGIALSYRHAKVDAAFIPGGGTINDVGISADIEWRSTWSVSVGTQYERWLYPFLAPGVQANFATTIGITYTPQGFRSGGRNNSDCAARGRI